MVSTPLESAEDLEHLLQPESRLEYELLQLSEFREGLMWGKPRFGHPEGQVALHVREILDNVESMSLQPEQRERLRLIAFAHDTFKFQEPRALPRDWSRHHAVLARQYMESHTDDEVVLQVIELHDEAFYIWRRLALYKQVELARDQLHELLSQLGNNLELYYQFFLCDTRTGDKLQTPIRWFQRVITDQGIQVD